MTNNDRDNRPWDSDRKKNAQDIQEKISETTQGQAADIKTQTGTDCGDINVNKQDIPWDPYKEVYAFKVYTPGIYNQFGDDYRYISYCLDPAIFTPGTLVYIQAMKAGALLEIYTPPKELHIYSEVTPGVHEKSGEPNLLLGLPGQLQTALLNFHLWQKQKRCALLKCHITTDLWYMWNYVIPRPEQTCNADIMCKSCFLNKLRSSLSIKGKYETTFYFYHLFQ